MLVGCNNEKVDKKPNNVTAKPKEETNVITEEVIEKAKNNLKTQAKEASVGEIEEIDIKVGTVETEENKKHLLTLMSQIGLSKDLKLTDTVITYEFFILPDEVENEEEHSGETENIKYRWKYYGVIQPKEVETMYILKESTGTEKIEN